jgi:hypothetical protein
MTRLLMFKERVKHESRHRWLKIKQYWIEWVDDIYSLNIPIRAKLFDEEVLFCQITH